MAKQLIVYTDGAARGNPGPAGVGGLVLDAGGRELMRVCEYIGEATNNVAEYAALILTLERLLNSPEHVGASVSIRSDSVLVVEQLTGFYKVKSPNLKELHARAKDLLARLAVSDVVAVRREENAAADRLANQAIDEFIDGTRTAVLVLRENRAQDSLF